MPHGKPAGLRCAQLSPDNLCRIFGSPDRPEVCVSYRATTEFCGKDREQAIRLLDALEAATGSRSTIEEE